MSQRPTTRLLDWIVPSPARPHPDPATMTQAEWDGLLAQAYRHKVTPQLFRILQPQAASGCVPARVLQCAWIAAALQRRAAVRLERDLPEVLQCLRERAVTPILLKGAHLATSVYAEPVLRAMVDFDLLVRPEAVDAAQQALHDAGYENRPSSFAEARADAHHLPPFVRNGRYSIEVHWTLAPPWFGLRVDLDGLWRRARPTLACGEPALVLAPEDALLHVCMHAAILHLFENGITPLLDVAAILERHGTSLDWGAVERRARDWGIARGVQLILLIAQRDCGAPVPEDVLARLQPDGIPPEVVEAARAELTEPDYRLGSVSVRTVAKACMRPWLLWQILFSGPTTLGGGFDTQRRWLHVIRRMDDLRRRFGALAWQLASGGSLRVRLGRAVRRKTVLTAWLGCTAYH